MEKGEGEKVRGEWREVERGEGERVRREWREVEKGVERG